MAPIHHHFELKGWPEPRVIVRFWIISRGAGAGRPGHVEGALMTTASTTRHARPPGCERARGRFDPWLLGVAIALAGVGVVMVASSSIAVADGQQWARSIS